MNQETVILRIPETVNSGNAAAVQGQLLAEVEGNEQRVVVDFSRNRYISSAGLRMLMEISNRVDGKNGKMVLLSVSDNTREVLAMTGFDELFEMADDLEAARKMF